MENKEIWDISIVTVWIILSCAMSGILGLIAGFTLGVKL